MKRLAYPEWSVYCGNKFFCSASDATLPYTMMKAYQSHTCPLDDIIAQGDGRQLSVYDVLDIDYVGGHRIPRMPEQ